MTLDDRGWKDIAAELSSMLDRIDKIHAASLARLKKADHEGQTSRHRW